MRQKDLTGFYQATRAAKKIIVVDLGFLGDTVHLVPALWEIKDHYPQASLHVLTTPVGAGLLKMVPCVDRAWSFPLGPPSPKWWEHLDILRAMRRERFDLAYNFGGADRSVFVTRFLRPRHALAYQSARKHFWQPWLIKNWLWRLPLPTPVYESRRHLLELCGFDLKPARFDLQVPAPDASWARDHIPEGAVHLSVNASNALQEWPMTNNLQLVQNLFTENFNRTIVATAAPNPREQARLEHLRRSISDARLVTIADCPSISRVAAVLQRCALHIGPDSGMLHLAVALKISTVSLFRRYANMANWLPTGPGHAHFDAPCPCMGDKNPPCAATGEAACFAGISAAAVAGEVRRLLDAKPRLR
jgi:ADP-heptose:LPS heptosyltransferase